MPRLRLAAPGSFDDTDAAFHAEPFESAYAFRASINYYASLLHPELLYKPALLVQEINIETLFL